MWRLKRLAGFVLAAGLSIGLTVAALWIVGVYISPMALSWFAEFIIFCLLFAGFAALTGRAMLWIAGRLKRKAEDQ